MKTLTFITFLVLISGTITAQKPNPFTADFSVPEVIPGMTLVWHDEFNIIGKPDSAFWRYERGFVRNEELQWYQSDNANCINGLLVIEGRREQIKNPNYVPGSTRWNQSREYAEYSSASIQTRGKKQWLFGHFEIRARIDTSMGAWPAIWTLGTTGGWPGCGEVDIMEFYRRNNVPIVLANVACRGTTGTKWHTETRPVNNFTATDPDWLKKFHVWKMDWDSVAIKLSLDDLVINTTLLKDTFNPDNRNPFVSPQFLLLNLALGRNGGDPSKTRFPVKYEVDYVRVYQTK